MANHPEKETLTVKFESDDSSADAIAVASTMQAVTILVRRVHDEYDKDKKFLVNARPFRKGSLEIPLDLVLFAGAILMQDPLFQKIRDILSEFLKLKCKLHGKPFRVTDGNVIVVENSDIQVDQLTIQMLKPSSLESVLFARAFGSIEADQKIKSVKVLSSAKKEPLADISREHFGCYQEPIAEEDISMPKEACSREIITIRAPSFDPQLAWRFIWAGVFIVAKVLDADFMKRVQARKEVFAKGDQLEVDLFRVQEYDPKTRTHVDRQFTVTHVWNHVKQIENRQMF